MSETPKPATMARATKVSRMIPLMPDYKLWGLPDPNDKPKLDADDKTTRKPAQNSSEKMPSSVPTLLSTIMNTNAANAVNTSPPEGADNHSVVPQSVTVSANSSSFSGLPPTPPHHVDPESFSQVMPQTQAQVPYEITLLAHLHSARLEISRLHYDYSHQITRLHQERERIERERDRWDVRFNYAVNIGMVHLSLKDAEIARLTRELRSAGIEPTSGLPPSLATQKPHYQQEVTMLLRLLCNWGKRFYKFPTTEQVPETVMQTLMEVCGDVKVLGELVRDVRTKYLVVVNVAMQYLVRHVLNGKFLRQTAKTIMDTDGTLELKSFNQVIDEIRGDQKFADAYYDALAAAALHHAQFLVDHLIPLLSRQTDPGHLELSHKQLGSVAQHAARFQLELCKRGATVEYIFFANGELFSASTMNETNSDKLGFDGVGGSGVGALALELRGANVELSVLPLVRVRIPGEEGERVWFIARKADVLVHYP